MPLHMTKVAFGAKSLDDMHQWWAHRGPEGYLTTRYLPKRHSEMVGGSVYWILKHQLVARSVILRFEETDGGRTNIVVSTKLIDVHPIPRRAHQGWRYLEDEDAPRDLSAGDAPGETDALPSDLAMELSRLGLF